MNNKILVHTNSYHGFTLQEALEGISKAGFKYVEIGAVRGWTEHIMPEMKEEKINEIKDLLKKLGLTAVGLSGHCNLMDKERLSDFINNIELASKLGCEYIITSTGEAHFGENEVFTDEQLVTNIKSILPSLEKYNIFMVLEVHGEYGTGASLAKVCKAVDSKYVGVNYDTANVVFYGNMQPEDEIKQCVDYVKYVHLKDHKGQNNVWNFPAVGKGDLKLKEFMEYMDTKGYEGPYSIEIEYTEDFTMRDKVKGDLEVANQAVKDSYDYLKSIGRI